MSIHLAYRSLNTHRKTSFMDPSRTCVPGLYLISEDDFHFAIVFTTFGEERDEDGVDGIRQLGTERADIVHYEGSKTKNIDDVSCNSCHTDTYRKCLGCEERHGIPR